MKKILLLFPLFVGCMGGSGSGQYQTEVALHKVRSDMEELKNDLHSHQMELSVLEGKVQSSEETLLTMRKENLHAEHGKADKHQMEISQLSQKLAQTDKRQEDLEKQVGHLLQYHTDVQKALAQYKDKINEVERHISLHNQTLAEVMKVKDHLKILSDMIATEGEGRSLQSYRVKAGDSLDKIAKEHKTSAETLRKINHMNNDLILAGQDLLVPKRVD